MMFVGNVNPDRTNLVVTIEGQYITSLNHFFCAMGEAINGIGGYFGRNLNALIDCGRRGFGVDGAFTLIWKQSDYSKQQLQKNGTYTFLMETLRDHMKLNLILE